MISSPTTNSGQAISSSSAAAAVQLGGAEEATDFLTAILLERGNRLLGMVKGQLESTTFFFSKMERLADLVNRFTDVAAGPRKPITPDTLTQFYSGVTDARSPFFENGPSLGSTIEEADALIAELSEIGISIEAPIKTVQYDEAVVVRKAPPVDEVQVFPLRAVWVRQEEFESIAVHGFKKLAYTDYPGSEAWELFLYNESEKEAYYYRSSLFTEFEMRRPSEAEVSRVMGTLRERFDNLLGEFSELLAEMSKAASKLDEQLQKHQDTSEESIKALDELRQRRDDTLNDFFRILRQYRQEQLLASSNTAVNPVATESRQPVEAVTAADDRRDIALQALLEQFARERPTAQPVLPPGLVEALQRLQRELPTQETAEQGAADLQIPSLPDAASEKAQKVQQSEPPALSALEQPMSTQNRTADPSREPSEQPSSADQRPVDGRLNDRPVKE